MFESGFDRQQISNSLYPGCFSTAAAWPLAARAQQQSRERRIGLLMSTPVDLLGQAWFAAFAQGLQELGWEAGRNVQISLARSSQLHGRQFYLQLGLSPTSYTGR